MGQPMVEQFPRNARKSSEFCLILLIQRRTRVGTLYEVIACTPIHIRIGSAAGETVENCSLV
jgi:hypothetical protein